MGGIISGKIVGAAQITSRVCASSISAGEYTITIDPVEGGYRLRVERGSEVQTIELLDGKAGADGQASYVHIKYSSVPNPASRDEMSDTPQDYIGIYTDNVQEDSDDPTDYTWARIKGEPGLKGDPGEPGQDAPQEAVLYTPQELSAEQQTQARENIAAASAERVEAMENALPGKLSEPAEGLAVGKYFRVAAIDENGHAVLEAVDAKDVGVQDVQVAGASVVADGVASVPIANTNNAGVAKVLQAYGIKIVNGDILALRSAANDEIDPRISNYRCIVPSNLDYAVKAAMCDGKGAAWTADEQAEARKRMGIPGEYELIEEITLAEAVNAIERSTEPDGTAYNFSNMFVKTYAPGGEGSATMNVRYYTTPGTSIIAYISLAVNTDDRYGMSKVETKYGYLEAYGCTAGSTTNMSVLNLTGTTYSEYMSRMGSITKLKINLQNGKLLPVGSKIEIYGVRS